MTTKSQTLRSRPVLFWFLAAAGLTLAFGLFSGFQALRSARTEGSPLLFHVAASLKAPAEQIAAAFHRETGMRVELSLGGSQTLLANIEITKLGDLFLPADDSYLVLAKEKGLVHEALPIGRQTAVLAVPKGNPRRIQSLNAESLSTVRLSQASPDTAAIGKLLRAATEASGLWQTLSNRTVVFKPTVVDAANDLKLGAVDGAFVWDSMEHQYPDLEFVRLSELNTVNANIAVAVLSGSRQPEAARRFAHFIVSEQGRKKFVNNGFKGVPATP